MTLPMNSRVALRPANCFLRLLATLLSLTLLSSCGGGFFVSQSTVTSLSLSPTNPTMEVGGTTQFVATGTTAGGTSLDVTSGTTWSSSDPSVATLSSDGLATALAAGVTTLSAKYEDGSTQTLITVSSATLSAITLSPIGASISIGGTQQYTATGSFSDGSSRDVTGSVTWSSSYTNVATISTGGLATGVGSGSTVITATSGAISALTTLTVN